MYIYSLQYITLYDMLYYNINKYIYIYINISIHIYIYIFIYLFLNMSKHVQNLVSNKSTRAFKYNATS